jgi:dihydroorotate dehydrogenase electron transfer subunit
MAPATTPGAEPARPHRGGTDRAPPAELIGAREIVAGEWLQTYHAPAVATGFRAGQYVQVLTAGGAAMSLRPFPIETADSSTGTIAIHLPADPPAQPVAAGLAWLRDRRPGDRVTIAGPLGRPFEIEPRARHLLLVAEGAGIFRLRALADEAIRSGRQVVLLLGTATAREVYPSSLLPDEVEYVVATGDGSMGHHGPVLDLVPDYEGWADQAFASGPTDLLRALARLATGRRQRLGVALLGRKRGAGRPVPPGSVQARRKAFLQVAVEQTIGCLAATCLGCVLVSATGSPLRACREGPVFAAGELDWELGS